VKKPTVGIFGLTGCAGDQLVILNCEDELLDLVGLLDIRDFAMAGSDNDQACPLDLAFVDGAVLSSRDEARLRAIRRRAQTLVAIGTCAAWGGVPAMDRQLDRDALATDIYGPLGRDFDTAPARALHEVVTVEFTLPGCPIEKHELLSAIASLLHGDPPLIPQYPVCAECAMRENACLLTVQGQTCLGPVTAGGCHARCPALAIPCIGCRGPTGDANVEGARKLFHEREPDIQLVAQRLTTFGPNPRTEQSRKGLHCAQDDSR
jgi:coenzyme F420-reducing hydrogenase gamma subunit